LSTCGYSRDLASYEKEVMDTYTSVQNLWILVQSLEREKLRTCAYSSKSQLDVY